MLRGNLPEANIPQDVADALRDELSRIKSLGKPVKAGYRFTEFYNLSRQVIGSPNSIGTSAKTKINNPSGSGVASYFRPHTNHKQNKGKHP